MHIDRHKPWKIEDLPWDRFDAARVDPELLKIVKAAALVEYNAGDYAAYLCNVFEGDEDFCSAVRNWSQEETQHGAALGQWAERADPGFSFQNAFERYTAGYRINIDVKESVRGSKAGELIARCIVETGTSSYYTTLGDATDEPVLKALCRAIASDELRHYKLFHDRLKTYADKEELGRLARLKIGLSRIGESEDDELAFAFYAANAPANAPYERAAYTSAYMARAYPLYRADHVERMVAMVFRACDVKLSNSARKIVKYAAHLLMKIKMRRALAMGAVLPG